MGQVVMEKQAGSSWRNCLFDFLPGEGPANILDGATGCEIAKEGSLTNELLAQGITLALNLRLTPELLAFKVDGARFITRERQDCTDLNSPGIAGTDLEQGFGREIVEKLGPDANVADLFHFVNKALSGADILPLSLDQVTEAAALVNSAFKGCVTLTHYGEVPDYGGGVDPQTGVDEKGKELEMYPNPAMEKLYLRIPSRIRSINHAAIYNMAGSEVINIQHLTESRGNQTVEIDVSHLIEGIYFVRINALNGSLTRRFAVQ